MSVVKLASVPAKVVDGGENVPRRNRSNRSAMVRNINQAHDELQLLLLSRKMMQKWERISFLRGVIQDCLIEFLTRDLKYCQLKGVEHKVWNICYHRVIEVLKKEFAKNLDTYGNILLNIIDEGVKYYGDMLKTLENTYNFEIKRFLSEDKPRFALGHVRMALFSAQKVYINLGDLERYRSFINDTIDDKAVQQYYTNAATIDSRSGRSYNRLALISMFKNRNFDAIYYYVRSANAPNEYSSARESILSYYDDIRKTYETKVPLKLILGTKQNKLESKNRKVEVMRNEVWILPDEIFEDENYIVTEENVREMKSRFMYSFLYVHAKLFLRVDMDNFRERAIHMLKEFNALITYTPISLTTEKMAQIAAISIHSVLSWKNKKDDGTNCDGDDDDAADTLPNLSIVIFFQIVGLVTKRAVDLLEDIVVTEADESTVETTVHEELNICLSLITIWTDWSTLHSNGWNPMPSCEAYKLDDCKSCWPYFTTLVNMLEKWRYEEMMELKYMKKIRNNNFLGTEGVEIKLPEFLFLVGFTPINTEDVPKPIYTYKDINMEIVRMCLRISKILKFSQYLCEIQPPILQLSAVSEDNCKSYICVAQILNKSLATRIQNKPSLFLDYEEHAGSSSSSSDSQIDGKESGVLLFPKEWTLNICGYNNNDDEPEENGDDKLNEDSRQKPCAGKLIDVRIFLQKKQSTDDESETKKEFEEHANTIMKTLICRVELEIIPQYVILDTNTFLDSISGINKIAEMTYRKNKDIFMFTLLIPIIVLQELKGLRNAVSIEVRQRAVLALKKLKCFRRRNIKYLSVLGNISSNIVALEDDENKITTKTNDDRILVACKTLCREHDESINDEGTKRIRRQMVLLTRDRNLRIKALTENIPSQDILDFMVWAKLN